MENNNTSAQNTNKGKGFLKWSIIVGIVIVLNLFFNYTISLVYKAPVYEDYVKQAQVIEPITNKDDCLKVGGQWNGNPGTPAVEVSPTDPAKTITVNGYCNPDYTNQNNFNNAMRSYNRNVFIILVTLGVLSIIAGVFVVHNILSSAFSWGGVISFIIAAVRYWGDANKFFQVLILALALIGLIWVAIKKFGNK